MKPTNRIERVISNLPMFAQARQLQAEADLKFANMIYGWYADWHHATGDDGIMVAPELESVDHIHREAVAELQCLRDRARLDAARAESKRTWEAPVIEDGQDDCDQVERGEGEKPARDEFGHHVNFETPLDDGYVDQ